MTISTKTQPRVIPLRFMNNAMIRLITFLLLLACALPTQAQQTIDKIIATVGDKVILKSDIEVQYQQYVAEGEATEELRCQLLDQLLAQKLLLTQAEVDSVVVGEDEVEIELNKRIRHFVNMIGSEQKLEEFYQKSVLEIKEEFREDIKDQLLAQRMQGQITADVKVTPSEVKDFFEEIPKDSLPRYNAEVEVGHIVVFAKPAKSSERAALEELREIRRSIVEDSSDFKLKAILYSDDPGSATKGGELPEFTRDDPFAPEFIAVSFRLQEGEISQPFETDFGYHIVQMLERKGERVRVRHILIIPEITGQDLKRAQRVTDSIYNLLSINQITFGQGVDRFSEDENTNKYGGMLTNPATGETYFELDELGAIDANIPFVIDTMDAGDISKSVMYTDRRGNRAYRLVYLKSVTEPHVANLEQDYMRIAGVALNRKKSLVTRNWLADRIKRTYISIDESFADCPEVDPWLSANP